MKTQDPENESPWVKTSVSNLVGYRPSAIYFARVRVAGKLIRQSLKTDVLSVPKIRLADLVHEDLVHEIRKGVETENVATNGKMTFGDALVLYRANLVSNRRLKPSAKLYREKSIQALCKTCLAWKAPTCARSARRTVWNRRQVTPSNTRHRCTTTRSEPCATFSK